ncbi:BrxA/BrxB family bacilliredoxin [Comamonas sp. JC664]|uniref:BrxA/BrxB family bacilliredoxin n=1 Tax=Comamonas sp. JC664 TaxID=2801917 RepID=UPI00174AE98E|nr:BrxA/BrxB family bacilliredoxin [Comamonas sp. JC664]MBL0692840.1 BrxA/BrxB family bacilliredoxin [Comamonas sp. JC664]GHG90801.1 UPF0403 protein YphP [Comamonas sp. KCTC 72670]
MPYNPLLIKPMREELTSIGVEELTTAEQVDAWMNNKTGTALLIVNSVSSAAASGARPGVRQALGNNRKPTRVATVFEGQDPEATARARGYFMDVPPSDPSMAFFRHGELVAFIPRHRIEGRTVEDVARELVSMFNEYCE